MVSIALFFSECLVRMERNHRAVENVGAHPSVCTVKQSIYVKIVKVGPTVNTKYIRTYVKHATGLHFAHIKKIRKHAKNVIRKHFVNMEDVQQDVVNATVLSIVITINYECVVGYVVGHRFVFITFIRRTVRHVVDPLFVNIIAENLFAKSAMGQGYANITDAE